MWVSLCITWKPSLIRIIKSGWNVSVGIAGQSNLVRVEVLKQLLEQLERSPWSLLIRCLALICLSAPEERSWSSCFCLPLLVRTFPGEETRDGQSGAFVPLLPSSTHSSRHMYILIYNEHVCPVEPCLICWWGGGTGRDDKKDLQMADRSLHTRCGSEVIQPSQSELCQWDLLFSNMSSSRQVC